MNEKNMRVYKKENNASKVYMNKFNVIVLSILLLVTISVVCCSLLTHAEEETNLTEGRYYSSIEIQKADTLWDIAQRYNTHETMNTQEYIELVMQINGLTSDMIYEGQHLIVACY